MTALVNADVVALQLEKVRDKVPLWYERDNVLFTKIEKKGDAVSTRDARIPIQLRPGGRFGLYNPDGGNMGRGTGTKYEVARVTPTHIKEAMELTKLAEMATDSSEKAIENALSKEVLNATQEIRTSIDKLLNRPSTGQLGEVAGVAGSVITLAADTSFAVSSKFRVGSGVDVVDAGLTTNRGTAVVTAISDAGPSITVDAVPGGTIATDLLFIEGTTVSAGAVTSTALYGIPYHQSDATSGTWLGLTRSATTLPEVITPSVDAGGGALTTAMVRLCTNKIRAALGIATDETSGLTWYINPAQTAAYEELGMEIAEIMKKPNADESLELFFGVKTINNIPVLESNHASKTRMDLLHLPSWGRVVTQDIDYFKIGSVKMFWPTTNGAPDAAYLWYLTTSFQLFNENPRRGAYIKNLLVPAGY